MKRLLLAACRLLLAPRLSFAAVLAILLAPTLHATTAYHRYYRFVPTLNRDRATNPSGATVVQLAEFEFFKSGVKLAPSAAVVTSSSVNHPANESPPKSYDGILGTKWLDFDYTTGGDLIFDFGSATRIDAYNFYTANDFPGRDPLSWNLEGRNSSDETWEPVDVVTRHATTQARSARATPTPFSLQSLLLSEPFDYPDGSALDAAFRWSADSGTAGSFTVSSGKLNVAEAASEGIRAELNDDSPYFFSSGVLAASFEVNLSALPSATGSYFAHFRDFDFGDGTSTFRACLHAFTNGAAPGMFRLGISNGYNPAIPLNLDLSLNSTHRVTLTWDLDQLRTSLSVNGSTPVTDLFSVDHMDAESFAFRQNPEIGTMTIDDLGIKHAYRHPGDDFVNASSLVGVAGKTRGTNVHARVEDLEPTQVESFSGGTSVWYRWAAPASASFTFSLAADFDSQLAIYTGTALGALDSIAEDDPGGYGGDTVTIQAQQGTTYSIRVSGYLQQTGNFTLSWGYSALSSTLPRFPSNHSLTEEFEGRPVDFTTGEVGVDDGFDLDRHSITFIPDGTGGYRYFVRPIKSLPVDMSQVPGGNPPSVTLTEGTFPFFGTNYTAFEVNYDGTISFGGGSNGGFGSTDLSGHLENSQIAVLGGDFYNESAGTYRVRESADKVTVHFEGLPDSGELENLSSSTFQAELFFDGTIRLSYFGVDAESGIVGLSNASGGSDESFVQEDFSSFQILPKTTYAVESQATATVSVTLTGISLLPTTFAYSCHDLSAVGGADYTPATGTATIVANTLSTSIPIPLLNDSRSETDESFLLRLSDPAHPEWIYGECEVWIIDDETVQPAPGLSADPSPRVRQLGNRVFIEPGGTGTAAFRIVSVAGGNLKDPVTGAVFAPGAVITLAQGVAGLISTSPETRFTIEAINAPSGNRIGVTSFDIDGPSQDTLFRFERQEVKADEGQMATLAVISSGPSESVHYEIIPGTATGFDGGGGDYLAKLLPLRFVHDRAVIEIPVFADQLDEGPEYFDVRLVGTGEGDYQSPESWARITLSDAGGPARHPLAVEVASPTAAADYFWPGDEESGAVAYLEGFPGLYQPVTSSPTWINIPITPQSESFVLSFTIETSGSDIDAIVGLSELPATAYGEVSAITRAAPYMPATSTPARWDAYDKSRTPPGYTALSTLTYAAGTKYHVWMEVDILAQRYDVRIESDFTEAAPILTQGQFRKSASVLRYLTMRALSGSTTVSEVKIHQTGASIPFHPQTGAFSVEFDLRTSGECRITTGLSNAAGTPETGMSAILKEIEEESFGPSKWAAWTSGNYFVSSLVSDNIESYHVRFDVNVPTGTYTVTLTPKFGDEFGEWTTEPFLLFGQGLGTFRAPASQLSHLNIAANAFGDFEITNIMTPPRAVAVPATGDNASGWTNIPFPRQTGRFSIYYDLETSSSPIDALSALCEAPPTSYNDATVTCRAGPDGNWDGWIASQTWSEDIVLPYAAGTTYRVTLDVDIDEQTYNATVTPRGQAAVKVFTSWPFRTETDSLSWLSIRSITGTLAISNISEPTAHPADGAKQSVGKIESSLGNGSGVAVADHAVLTSARLIFDEATLAFASDIDWKHRYYVNRPTGAFLLTDYAAQALADTAPGNGVADSLDVAVLAFRPLLVPEIDNAPGLGGYAGFLIDPNPAAGGNPWLTGAGTRVLSFYAGASTPFALQENLQQTAATGLPFVHQGRGVYSCSSLSAVAGTQGSPLFALHSNGRYYPAAICLGEAGGTSRFRVVDDAIAHTIYRANLLQQAFESGENLNLAGVEWRPEAIDTSVLQSYGAISAALLPESATWAVFSNESITNQPLRTSTGGKAISVLPGSYTVRLYGAAGFSLPSPSEFEFGVSAGDLIVIPESYVAHAPATFAIWLAEHYNAGERSLVSVAGPDTMVPWMSLENLAAYAFGINPKGTTMPFADPEAQTPGLPVITVDCSTSPPTFRIDFLQRIAANVTYTVEFNDSLTGTWIPVPPVLLPLPDNTDWYHASLTTSPPLSATGKKFTRVKVTLNP